MNVNCRFIDIRCCYFIGYNQLNKLLILFAFRNNIDRYQLVCKNLSL